MIGHVSPRRRKSPELSEQEKTQRKAAGQRLKELRKRTHPEIPQDIAASLIMVSFATYHKWEIGVNPVDSEKIPTLSAIFGQPPGAFFEQPGTDTSAPHVTKAFEITINPAASVDETLAHAARKAVEDLNRAYQTTRQIRVTKRTGTRKP